MAKHHFTKSTPYQAAQRMAATYLGRLHEHLLALVDEWRARRNIERSLSKLSNFYLRDVGMTKADVEAACSDSFNHSASRALMSVAQNRAGNW